MSKQREERARRGQVARATRAAKAPLRGREKHRVAATEIAERQREVGRMHLERIPQWEIAERLKLTEATVSRDLKAVREEWRAEARSNVGEATEREIKSLEASEARLRASWTRILANRRMKPGLRTLAECKLNAELVRIATHRAKLLGLEAPAKVVHTGAGGGPIGHDVRAQVAVNPVAVVVDPELRRLACELLERAAVDHERTGGAGGADRSADERRDPREALPGGAGEVREQGAVEAGAAPGEAEPAPG